MHRRRLAFALAAALAACACAPAAGLAATPKSAFRQLAAPRHAAPRAHAADFYGPSRTAHGRMYQLGQASCGGSTVGVSAQSFMAANNGSTEYVAVTSFIRRWNGSSWAPYGNSRPVYAAGWGSAAIGYESQWLFADGSYAPGAPGAFWTVPRGYYAFAQAITWINAGTGATVDSTAGLVSNGDYCTV